ncbi:hypothetical protein THASP1DRAFT_33567 [Thamnocephalis sphaerospora]|uniref:Uncharacterized protein n=1 Tax=Thamnocephalis sphaerospora TaxID=78915 RepID=A0A4P9XHA7_9FUNG|nr:hypothetical protein THASP1DRAFT_33567 [Thamnocephalis sphaerospora]|eukprot:RKP04641.1 hypothetical protein THASP1DRAFT_33567 [Thamnocephalis sphaerospora]
MSQSRTPALPDEALETSEEQEARLAQEKEVAVCLCGNCTIRFEKKTDMKVTPELIASLTDIAYDKLVDMGYDLALFANHARRRVVRVDDIEASGG